MNCRSLDLGFLLLHQANASGKTIRDQPEQRSGRKAAMGVFDTRATRSNLMLVVHNPKGFLREKVYSRELNKALRIHLASPKALNKLFVSFSIHQISVSFSDCSKHFDSEASLRLTAF
jgi:hypothetical protein